MLSIRKSIFGHIKDRPVNLYTIANDSGLTCRLTDYGGIITSICVPDKSGQSSEVVLGFEDLDSYVSGHPYFGAIIGRIANRISHSSFNLDEKRYDLHANNGLHHLHGGLEGFDKKLWSSKILKGENSISVIMHYISLDGEENYPGNLDCQVIFTFYTDNRIDIEYKCTTDKKTIVNLTHHDYFNLHDGGKSSALNHELLINADRYTLTDKNLCPTGEIAFAADTHFDFNNYKNVGEKILKKDGALKYGQGYDINYITNHESGQRVASLREPTTRRQLDIYSNQPCLHLYTSGHLDGSLSRSEQPFNAYSGICLESQSYPNAINHSNFPTVILQPGEVYIYKTSYEFKVY